MGVDTEPRAAELPLAGGRPGTAVRVRPLLTAEMAAPRAFLARPAGRLAGPRGWTATLRRRDPVWIPIPAFLVEHPGAGAILVDTGLHASVGADGRGNLGPFGRVVDVRMDTGQDAAATLRRLGVDTADVRVVVMTHLHYDHASGVVDFPAATFVVSRAEWEAASGPRPALRGYVPHTFDHAFDWRTIDYGDPAVKSFATFGRAVDLFGDGSVRLLSTPGHSAGHQSVLLRLAERELLLTGDAAYTTEALAGRETPLRADDAHRFRRSVGELRRFLDLTPRAVAICGHDPDGWSAVETVYA